MSFYSDTVLEDAPVAYWRLDDASGTTMADSSGYTHDGDYLNAPTLAQTALVLDDVTPDGFSVQFDAAAVQYGTSGPLSALAFTAEAWIKPDVVSGYGQIMGQDAIAPRGWNVYVVDGFIGAHFALTDEWVWSVTAVEVGGVYHVVVTYDGSEGKVWINGVLDATGAISGQAALAGLPFYIGATPAGVGTGTGTDNYFPFDGFIDEVAFYDSALDVTRITAHYHAARTTTPPAAWFWSGDEADLDRRMTRLDPANGGLLEIEVWWDTETGVDFGRPEYANSGDGGATFNPVFRDSSYAAYAPNLDGTSGVWRTKAYWVTPSNEYFGVLYHSDATTSLDGVKVGRVWMNGVLIGDPADTTDWTLNGWTVEGDAPPESMAAVLGLSVGMTAALSKGTRLASTQGLSVGMTANLTVITHHHQLASNLGLSVGMAADLTVIPGPLPLAPLFHLEPRMVVNLLSSPGVMEEVEFRSDSAMQVYGFISATDFDPSIGFPQFRLLIVDLNGRAYCELENAKINGIGWALADIGVLDFNLPATDPKIKYVQPVLREAQVWMGDRLIWWGVITRAQGSGQMVNYQCATLEWYFTMRVVGRVPAADLLAGGSFNRGMGAFDFRGLPGNSGDGPPGRPFHELAYKDTGQVLTGGKSLRMRTDEGFALESMPVNTAFRPSSGEAVWVDLDLAADEVPYLVNPAQMDDDDDVQHYEALTGVGLDMLDSVANDMNNEHGVIEVTVSTSDEELHEQTKRRARKVASYLQKVLPKAVIRATGIGKQERYPDYLMVAYNGTVASRQFMTQQVVFKAPEESGDPILATCVAWVYLEAFLGPAINNWGLVVERRAMNTPDPQPKMADKGYTKVLDRAFLPLTASSPAQTWIRLEVPIKVPSDGKRYILDARLFVPAGALYCDEIRFTYDEGLRFRNREQAQIIRGLVNHAQDRRMGKSNLRIEPRVQRTDVRRTRMYLFADRQNISEALNEIQNFADGGEWAIEVTPNNRLFKHYFPRKGTNKPIVLALGSNISTYDVSVDGVEAASTVVIQSEGEGSDREERSVSDATLFDGTVLERVYNATPGSSMSSLLMQAMRGLARYRRPLIIPSVTLTPEASLELLDRVQTGDRVFLEIENAWVDVTGKYRITSIDLNLTTRQLTFGVSPEDIKVKNLINYDDRGWRYKHQAQVPITGDGNHHPVESNLAWAAEDFDDSGWDIGRAPFGWTQGGDGETSIHTTVPDKHEVWMRKTFRATGDVYVGVLVDSWAFVYINGHLLDDGPFDGLDLRGKGHRGPIVVPSSWLNDSGVQTIAVHVQDRLADYGGAGDPDILLAGVRVRGTYEETETR